jgi:hypothetical protein
VTVTVLRLARLAVIAAAAFACDPSAAAGQAGGLPTQASPPSTRRLVRQLTQQVTTLQRSLQASQADVVGRLRTIDKSQAAVRRNQAAIKADVADAGSLSPLGVVAQFLAAVAAIAAAIAAWAASRQANAANTAVEVARAEAASAERARLDALRAYVIDVPLGMGSEPEIADGIPLTDEHGKPRLIDFGEVASRTDDLLSAAWVLRSLAETWGADLRSCMKQHFAAPLAK